MKQICSRCICDNSISGIEYDEHGMCNFCHDYNERDKDYPLNELGQQKLEKIINKIKDDGKNKEYDCVIGTSGGTDSTYCLYLADKWGLKPLAVHLDNGWNSIIAEDNIKKTTNDLNIDLCRVEVDWEEFRDLQIAFLKASVPDVEVPTDIGIQSVLYQTAFKNNIKHIIGGSCFRIEGNQPPSWGYGDGKYIQSVYSKYGQNNNLKNFQNITIFDLMNYHFIKRINFIKPLFYVDYQKEKVIQLLKDELGWKYYGGHHYESIYTRFIHGYYLPEKFGIDKRIIEYSALIRSGQMKREEALAKIKEPIYSVEQIEKDKEYILNKLEISNKEFETIMSAENKSFTDYKTYYPLILKMKKFIGIAHKLNLYPDKVYGKYSK